MCDMEVLQLKKEGAKKSWRNSFKFNNNNDA